MLIYLTFLMSLVSASFVPNVYLIEFEKSPISRRHVKRSNLYDRLNALDIQFNVRHEYDLIHAVSIEFKTIGDSRLFFENTMDIKRVWPVVSQFFTFCETYT